MKTTKGTAARKDRSDADHGRGEQPQVSGKPAPDYRPDWECYSGSEVINLFDAVALSCDLDPRIPWPTGSAQDDDFAERERLSRKRLKIATTNAGYAFKARMVRAPSGGPPTYFVRLSVFVEFAIRMEKRSRHWRPLPDGFVALAPGKAPMSWPWGDGYETEALRLAAEAVRNFWLKFNPEKPLSAPTKEKVTDWLKAKAKAEGIKMTGNLAKAIALVIRSEEAPLGARPTPVRDG